MGTTTVHPVDISTTANVKRSWLSRLGAIFGKILGVIQKAEPSAAAVAEALLPQFAPEIAMSEDIFNRIARWAIVAETNMAAVGTASGTGAQKLEIVLTNVGPVMDAWVTANFPGHTQVSAVAKSKVISAVVDLLNELSTPAVPV